MPAPLFSWLSTRAFWLTTFQKCHSEERSDEESQAGGDNTRFLTFTSFWFGMTTPQIQTDSLLVLQRLWRTALVLALFLSLPLLSFAVVTNQEVEEALTCQCGCGLTVHSCNHLQCGFAVPAKKRIADLVSQGKGKEEITALFVAGDGESPGYGEKVLSAPTTSGFNLAAWITPFLAVLGGGIVIGIISLRWSRRRRNNAPAPQSLAAAVDQYRDRLKNELDSFEG